VKISEKSICELLSAALPSGRLNDCFESDAEVVRLNGAECLFTTDEFSAEDLFREGDAHLLGWNIAAGAISDIYACGGQPLYYAHALTVAEGWDAAYLGRFAGGVREVLEATGARFIGGDCGRSKVWRCTASVLGACNGPPVLRRGAAAGDAVYLSGPVGAGNVEAALRLVEGRSAEAEGSGRRSLRQGSGLPNPSGSARSSPRRRAGGSGASRRLGRLLGEGAARMGPGLGAALRLPVRRQESALMRRYASACIDTSDGVWAALNALADLNGCGYAVADLPYLAGGLDLCRKVSLPKTLLFLGECGEYELLFTLRPEREEAFVAAARESGCAFYRLGSMRPAARTLCEDGRTTDLASLCIQARDYATPEEYLETVLRWLAPPSAHQEKGSEQRS
jgi:thiamine-monophosphate kinase